MKKFFKSFILCVLILPCILFLTACSNELSAYDIAVRNGFSGTEQQWLESLKGTDGRDGADGEDAINDITEIYEKAQESGYTGTFLEFLQEYLSIDLNSYNTTYASNKAMLSVVSVWCEFTSSESNPYLGDDTYNSAGAGVIYQLDKTNGNAIIITNFHVVFEVNSTEPNHISNNISVYLYGQERIEYGIPATYVGGSMNYDIAVLRISENDMLKNSNARQAELGNSNDITLGEIAIAVGNPLAEGLSVTSGVLSVDSEYIQMTAPDGITLVEFRVMRIDTAVNGGNSGGGLFNSKGELIGIVNAKDVSDEVENMSYCIPVNVAVGVVKNIIFNDTSHVELCTMGIMVESVESKGVYDTETLKTSIVEKIVVKEIDSTAAAKGILQSEDILKSIEIDGTVYNITRLFHLKDALLRCKINTDYEITVLRGGVEQVLNISFSQSNLTTIV